MPAADPPPACRKCKAAPGVFTLRAESYCRDCYGSYIRSKCIKRMETFRIRQNDLSKPTLLLALSLGVSSLSLLDLVSRQLATQRAKARRTAYDLLVLHVDCSAIDADVPSRAAFDAVKARYPDVGTFETVALEEVYGYDPSAAEEAEMEAAQAIPEMEDRSTTGVQASRLRALLTALPSPTSRMDIASILRTRLISAVATQRGCTAILWGDSTTRLAEKTLAATAKGRGFSLPWTIADGAVPGAGGVTSVYPVRDLFKKELVAYAAEVADPPLSAHVAEVRHSAAAATSGRNITVDELMTQYFADMEEAYPSIVSNVVRTAGRLEVKDKDAAVCRICGLPGDGGGGGLTLGAVGKDGERHTGGEADGEVGERCYGCIRSLHGANVEKMDWPSGWQAGEG